MRGKSKGIIKSLFSKIVAARDGRLLVRVAVYRETTVYTLYSNVFLVLLNV